MLRPVLIQLVITSIALAAVSRHPLEKKPEEYKDDDGCWVSANQKFIPIGESVPSLAQCEQYTCTATGVLIESCGAVGVAPPCHETRDDSLPYPDCCTKIVCPERKK